MYNFCDCFELSQSISEVVINGNHPEATIDFVVPEPKVFTLAISNSGSGDVRYEIGEINDIGGAWVASGNVRTGLFERSLYLPAGEYALTVFCVVAAADGYTDTCNARVSLTTLPPRKSPYKQ